MALPSNKIKKVKLPNNTEYEIIPERLQNSNYAAELPTLTNDAIIITDLNLKTINNTSLVGTGNLNIGGSATWGAISGNLSDQTDLNTVLANKMDKVNPTGSGNFSFNTGVATNNSVAIGDNTSATGNYSFAEGLDTIALGNYSHAEGQSTNASGHYSHAEGFNVSASGWYSHAEGRNTSASGFRSHAEGQNTSASGTAAHTEGTETNASGYYSHAEGRNTSASSGASHAEGNNSSASGACAHAEGLDTAASGYYSHAEGDGTIAFGNASHAEGSGTIAYADGSHAEGDQTQANGSASHTEGVTTIASGDASHAEGISTEASGYASHAEGIGTIANHASQHVFGENNIEDPNTAGSSSRGTYVEIVGNGNYSVSSNARTLDWSGNETLAGNIKLGNHTTLANNSNSDITLTLPSTSGTIALTSDIPASVDPAILSDFTETDGTTTHGESYAWTGPVNDIYTLTITFTDGKEHRPFVCYNSNNTQVMVELAFTAVSNNTSTITMKTNSKFIGKIYSI